jgi:ankyrin repeat protein
MAKGQHSDIIEMLLMHGAGVNAPDKYGLTPLHYATMTDNPDEVKTLLDHSANPNARDYKVGDTPLILAAANGYKAVVKLLLENGEGQSGGRQGDASRLGDTH